MKIRLPLPSDFSFDAVVRSHGWYDLPPFLYDRAGGSLTTAILSAEGRAATVLFRLRGGKLEASAKGISRETLRRVSRRVFSLELDLAQGAALFADRPDLARALARGGGRLLRAPTLFEDAVKVLLTTNCSWAATRGMVVRLIDLAGTEKRTFPPPVALARLSVSTLRSRARCGYRSESLACFARRVAAGKLDLSDWERPQRPAAEIREAILAERGFGPYAAEGLLRILGRHDFLALDSWVRQKYRRLYPGPSEATDRAIARRYARYGRHRGLALWLDMTSEWHESKASLWP